MTLYINKNNASILPKSRIASKIVKAKKSQTVILPSIDISTVFDKVTYNTIPVAINK